MIRPEGPPSRWALDFVALVGTLCVMVGLGWWVHPGAALSAIGVLLISLAVRGAWR